MEFGILGPLEVRQDGRPTAIGGTKQRRVVATLALHAGRVVSLSQLVDAVWDGEPPATARKQVQNAVSALRRTPVGAVLAAEGPGYVLRVPAEQVDAGRFDRLLAEAHAARTARDPAHAAALLRAGLAIWRGPALAGVGGRTVSAAAAQLEDRRLSAVLAWAEIALELGSHGAVADELPAEIDRYPLCEPLAGLQMLALYRAGRAAESLVCYERIRRTIAGELGVDPGPELQSRYQRILAADPELNHRPGARPARNHLPRDVGHFTGRSAELDRISSVADSGGVTVIQAIDGMGGVGKTAMAVHAAHRLAGRFADGQLFVDLHGHTAGRDPLTADEALDVLLRAVGVSDARIPKSPDEKSAMWRGELAGRRVLVVLDNALNSAQVEPLLPGSAGCAVLITSRRRLTGLIGAEVLSLDTLPTDDAVALFRAVAGPDRGEAEPTAVAEVVRLCGHLPLAIGIAAARFRVRPQWGLSDLVDRLSDDRGRTRLLQSDDWGITAAFALSYRHLADAERRMFRLLGLHPGADVDVFAAAALAGLPLDEAEHLLDALCDMHLLIAYRPGRYRLHDLVRDFARATVEADESAPGRSDARDRLLDYYTHVTRIAAEMDNPRRPRLGASPRYRPAAVPRMSRPAEVRAWAAAEHANLVAVARLAARHRAGGEGWQLPREVGSLLYESGQFSAGLEVFKIALAACRPDTPPAVRSACQVDVSLIHKVMGRYRLALEYLEQGTADAAVAGDLDSIARTLIHKADLSHLVGAFTDSIDYATRSFEVYQELGDVWRAAVALTIMMDAMSQLGRDREAIGVADRAALPLAGFANLRQVSAILSRRGTAHSQLGEHDVAIRLLTESLELARQGEDRRFEADYLHRLAEAIRRSGRPREALAPATEAMTILDDIPDPVDLAETHNVLGAIHNDIREYEVAAGHYRRTLDLTENVEYRSARAHALRGITRSLTALGHPEAETHHQQALALYAELGLPDAGPLDDAAVRVAGQ
ncbi:AfsR/SARP family transcriptional regulator [Actinoplanes couchii]|uniref:SARP family transcriptional regulator n=1 Tax=Actinoplanes couchii TaxID=403638 RepID=A0ABQ3X4Z6_9ACTN|nr:BTAD domain-containing putative transcriptional regulator [Actinoplanes couchii]MDR6326073.1 DNA-binding SARP family transcriptional activator [Actinoplanes couchii]GID53574.1 SARP family transcriptional regulator [Actinoplanes couchii]